MFASLISFTPFDLPFYTSSPNVPPKNLCRTFGAYFAGGIMFLFGWASYIIPFLVFLLGVRIFKQMLPDLRFPRIIGIVVLLLAASGFLGLLNTSNQSLAFLFGGFLGYIFASFFSNYFGRLGAFILFSTLMVLSFALVTEILVSTFFKSISRFLKLIVSFLKGIFKRERKKIELKKPAIETSRSVPEPVSIKTKDSPAEMPLKVISPSPKPKIQISAKPNKEESLSVKSKELKIGDYRLPGLDLLDSPPPLEARQIKEDLANNARVLEETLEDFGISVKVTDIERGPVITRYELEPAPGVKLNRIVSLNDDIALAMKAPSVRIVAPIPGKARVGVEVPNMQGSFVYLKEVIASKEFQESSSKLTLALGKDIAGYPVVTALDDMPHLLIAGTTGSGKTVCVNSLIISLLMRNSPSDLKMIMVDPKMVELAPFNGLPHLICPVVTDAKKASVALGWVVGEMEQRYQLLAKEGARNINVYNEKKEKIPYIVVIIDELADLMMVARDQIESAITRLAQLSRAVGIHLVMATQRPSVDVVTGVIKANFPARISFKVASKVDSRTVLDMNGADKLLGKGDMLFMRPGEEKLIRAQGALVKDSEIERIVNFIKSQAEPEYNEEVLKGQHKASSGVEDKDELYDEAVRIIMETNQASVSILQRRLRLGYTRAARIIDVMEQEGLVGPFEGSKPRKILVDREAWLRSNTLAQPQPKEEEG